MFEAIDWQQVLLIGGILFAATVVVRLAGFGGSLVAMPLIVPSLGLAVSAALMNLFGVTNFSFVIFQQWRDLTFGDVWRIILAGALFYGVGIWMVVYIPESVMRFGLGVICILFALYGLAKLPFPRLMHPIWEWATGVFAGLFGGAFSVSGVPAILYASTQDWEPVRFRLNMFTFFLSMSFIGVILRIFAGQITGELIAIWLTAVPFLFAGIRLGEFLTRFVSREQFRQIVHVLLIILGVRMINSALG
ncbi:MAG: sulfite exporter TauE/SafE family protein [Chloroflexota bacterium]